MCKAVIKAKRGYLNNLKYILISHYFLHCKIKALERVCVKTFDLCCVYVRLLYVGYILGFYIMSSVQSLYSVIMFGTVRPLSQTFL